MATSILPDTDIDYDVIVMLYFVKLFLTSFALYFAGFRGNDLVLFAAGIAFIFLPIAAIIFSLFRVFQSTASASAQGFSWVFGYFMASVMGILQGERSLFSLPTEDDAYFSLLGGLPQEIQDVVNILVAPGSENSFFAYGLAPIIYLGILEVSYYAAKKTGWSFLESKSVIFVLTAVPVGILFALLHGARDLQFVMYGTFLMGIMWILPELYEDYTEERVFGLIPIGLLFGAGWHQAHNQIASDSTYFELIQTLVSSGEWELQMIGWMEAGWVLLAVLLSMNYLIVNADRIHSFVYR